MDNKRIFILDPKILLKTDIFFSALSESLAYYTYVPNQTAINFKGIFNIFDKLEKNHNLNFGNIIAEIKKVAPGFSDSDMIKGIQDVFSGKYKKDSFYDFESFDQLMEKEKGNILIYSKENNSPTDLLEHIIKERIKKQYNILKEHSSASEGNLLLNNDTKPVIITESKEIKKEEGIIKLTEKFRNRKPVIVDSDIQVLTELSKRKKDAQLFLIDAHSLTNTKGIRQAKSLKDFINPNVSPEGNRPAYGINGLS